LNTAADAAEDWIAGDADLSHEQMRAIRDDRIALISKVIIPFAGRHLPHSRLFVSLKEIEIRALASGKAIPSLDEILSCINAARSEGGCAQASARSPAASVGLEATKEHIVALHRLFRIVLSVALRSPDLLANLQRRYSQRDMHEVLAGWANLVPVYLVCSNVGYPSGGGEEFLRETCKIMHELGFACVWVSFADSKLRPHPKRTILRTPTYLDVREAGGLTRQEIDAAVQRWSPDLVHSQGFANEFVAAAAMRFRVPALIGYHFWQGLIDLGVTHNRKILQNAAHHKLAPTSNAMKAKQVTRYVASEFMADVYQSFGGRPPLAIYHPISDPAHYATDHMHLGDFVLQLNISAGKGGQILLECIKKLGSKIPFFAVQTEPLSEELDLQIKDAVATSSNSVYAEYGPVRDYYSRARLVIIPTLVDETFCRVAFEAAMNGIPVICTRNGFLPYMFGDSGIYLSEDAIVWATTIESLYPDLERLRQIGSSQKAHVQGLYGHLPEKFMDAALHSAAMSPKRNMGFFTAWADQGLGYQARHYAKLFRRAGFKSHVFSFQPYAASGRALIAQHDPEDWSAPEHADSVYYSFNGREQVTTNELEQFVRANNVGTLVCPEICWDPNWSRLEHLSVENLVISAVPNIETVRSKEAIRHNALDLTWYNTRLAERILRNLGVQNGIYIGHGFGDALDGGFAERKINRLRSRNFIEFVHVGGYNPVGRKQTHLVVEAFAQARRSRKDIHLTVAVMNSPIELQQTRNADGINVIEGILKHEQILDLYEQSDVSIQVSSHEGLGLGFYESISRGAPVISLDVPPHNEVVLYGQTGWLLEAGSTPMPDNDDALFSAATFDMRSLTAILNDFCPVYSGYSCKPTV
jgi:glycosyltransferase involved in cell wall biosynthesis